MVPPILLVYLGGLIVIPALTFAEYLDTISDWGTADEIHEMMDELYKADDKINLSSNPLAVKYSNIIKLREETIAKLQGMTIPKRKGNATRIREERLYELERNMEIYKKWMKELTPTPS